MNVRRRLLALIGALAFSVSLLAVFVSGEGVAGQELDLFFSEYIEGTGNNKALEIYNPTDTEIVLQESNYRVYFYFNGNSTIGENIQLTGKVPAKGVFVLYHSGIFNQGTGNAGLQQAINSIDDSNNKQANSSSWYNGDDAIELVKNGVPIDRFGKIGEDPGTHWTGSAGGATVQTSDRTLVRKPNIFSGFTDNIENFDPSLEWKEYPTNTSTYLGWHSVEYTVTFQPGLHGTLGSGEAAQSVAHGEDAVPPQVIPNEGYLHRGWSQSYQNVTSDLTITALYTLKTYTVAFDLDGKGFHESGSLLQTVDHGKDASPPAVKPLEGYLLFGWDQRYSNVKENREIKALYQTWTSPGVFFSEYVEGSGNNKALEIYNGTGDVIDLAAGHYQVHIDFNGGTSLPTISLHGMIEPGGVFVLVHSGANEALKAKANQITSHNMFNGNDVVLLLKDGVVIDCFGKPGEELDAGVDDSEKIKGWMGGGGPDRKPDSGPKTLGRGRGDGYTLSTGRSRFFL